MGVVKGAIGITDNVTAVLQGIRREQNSFRQDVAHTREELTRTWDKKREARIETSAASKAMDKLRKKVEPLRKSVVTAVAVKDTATAKIKSVAKSVTSVGKMVAKPVVNITVKGMQALSAAGKAVAKVGKVAAIGAGAVAAVGGIALGALFSGSTEAATAYMEAETQLAQVMRNTMEAADSEIQSVVALAQAQEGIGVVSAGVQMSGMQELGTYIEEADSLKYLMPVMNDMLAQQYGLNATQENAVNIGTMMGKVLNGQTSALSRLGYSFSEAQEKVLKYGTESEKVAVLADVIQESVGGMNEAMANTDHGIIKQMENAYGSMKEEVGKLGIALKSNLAGVIMKNMPVIQKLGTSLMDAVGKAADVAIPMLDKAITTVIPVIENVLDRVGKAAEVIVPVMSELFTGFGERAAEIRPVLLSVIKSFKPLLPVLQQFGSTVIKTVQKVAASAMPVVAAVIDTVQQVIPAVLPVLETVVSTIGDIFTRAAPVIAGLVTAIGGAVSTLAPVFRAIFSEIGEKVGSVIGFVSERMGFIQEVFDTAVPLIKDVLQTAWKVISPIMNLTINVFKTLFSVVQRVFPGIQKVIETVWAVIKPIVEALGSVIGFVADTIGSIGDAISGGVSADYDVSAYGAPSTGSAANIGYNASGTNRWRGGPTWVGERGPELLEVPKGARILPTKESVNYATRSAGAADSNGGLIQQISINIAQLAEQIVIRDDRDIDDLANQVGEKVAKIVAQAARNQVPVPA